MKYILSLFIVVLFYGCFNAKRQYPDNFNAYNDSIDICIERFQQERDTSLLLRLSVIAMSWRKCSLTGKDGLPLYRRNANCLAWLESSERLSYYKVRLWSCLTIMMCADWNFMVLNTNVKEIRQSRHYILIRLLQNVIKIFLWEITWLKSWVVDYVGQERWSKIYIKRISENHNDEDVRIMLDNFNCCVKRLVRACYCCMVLIYRNSNKGK